VTAAPMFDPSTWNWTLEIATVSEATAVTVMVPDTVAPEVGEVMETERSLVPGLPPEPVVPQAALKSASSTATTHILRLVLPAILVARLPGIMVCVLGSI